jgi:hypothetical protein
VAETCGVRSHRNPWHINQSGKVASNLTLQAKMTKEVKIILIGFAVFAVGFGTFIVLNTIRFIKFSEHDPASTTLHRVDTIPSEDSSLFSPASLTRMKVEFGFQNKYRHVSYILLNRQYELEMTPYDLAKNAPLSALIHLKQKWSGTTDLETYTPVNLYDRGKFSFRLAPLQPLNDIFLTYYGQEIDTIVSNDSLLQYQFVCKDLSIRKAPDSPADLVLTNDKGFFGPTLHIDLILYRRLDKVYFLFFTPIDYERHVEPIIAGKLFNE